MIINKLKAIADIIAPAAGYKGLFFRSDTGVPAVIDENGVVSDLVIPGDASGVTYTPADSLNWTDSVDPGNVDDALDDLASRMSALEDEAAPDAAQVTYTPQTSLHWTDSEDPGNVDDALDDLAARVSGIEEGGTVSDAADLTYTPAVLADWNGAADPGNGKQAFDQLAERVADLEASPGVSDAADVTYTPSVLADWDGSADPGDVDNALNQLAERVTDVEALSAATITNAIEIACSDETTALTTGTAKVTFRMPYAMTLTSVKASVTTAPTDATLNVDINKTGTGSILSTVITIDASEKTSTTAATPPVISTSSLSADDEITIDIDQVGSTIAGAGLKVYLIGTVSGSVNVSGLTVDASNVSFTPTNSIHWTDSEDPGDVDDALNDLASRVQAIEEDGGAEDLGVIHCYEEQPSGTDGGNSVAAWTTRVLNTTKSNTISSASLSSNQISLPAGTYDINARVPCFANATSTGFKARLYDATAAATLIDGTSSWASANAEMSCFVQGRFTLSVTSNVRIEMIATAVRTSGWGVNAAISSVANHFTDVVIRRVS